MRVQAPDLKSLTYQDIRELGNTYREIRPDAPEWSDVPVFDTNQPVNNRISYANANVRTNRPIPAVEEPVAGVQFGNET